MEALQKARAERWAGATGSRWARAAIDSDIDVLVEMSDEASLLHLVQFQQALEVMLNRRADVLTVRGINPYLRERIRAEAVRL